GITSKFEPIILTAGSLLCGVFLPLCYRSQELIDASWCFREASYHCVLKVR
ncbi:Odorant receptor 28, partial [Frankliniella occidentalis]